MPLHDPRRPVGLGQHRRDLITGAELVRVNQRIADLEYEVRLLRNSGPPAPAVAGPPVTAPRDGTLGTDPATRYLWVRSGGGWCYVPTTPV